MALSDAVVLLGEPDRATRELYYRALSAEFVTLAADERGAIADTLHTNQIAALVIEPMLFGVAGWAELATISRDCAEQGIALIICTTLDEGWRGTELGAAEYLLKPTLPSALVATVQQVLGPGKNKR